MRATWVVVVVAASFVFVLTVEGLAVLKSTATLGEYGEKQSGAKLINVDPKVDESNFPGITICVRANIKKLGLHEGPSRLITIEDWRENGEVKVAMNK